MTAEEITNPECEDELQEEAVIDVEICSCPETIGLDTEHTTWSEGDAAAEFIGEAIRNVETIRRPGLTISADRAQGQRILHHGWRGAQVFCPDRDNPPLLCARKSGLWLTYDKIDNALADEIDHAVNAAWDAAAAELAKHAIPADGE